MAGRDGTPNARGALEQCRRAGARPGAVVAGAGVAVESVAVRYFWSDQYDIKIQCLGEPEADDVVHLVEDDGRKFLAYYERDGVVAGVVGGGMPGRS